MKRHILQRAGGSRKNAGFGLISLILLIGAIIGALWYFKVDVRGYIGLEPEIRHKYVYRAKFDELWYGYLAWYDKKAEENKFIGWFQNHINNIVRNDGATTTETEIDQ